jgi:hypothetical protein
MFDLNIVLEVVERREPDYRLSAVRSAKLSKAILKASFPLMVLPRFIIWCRATATSRGQMGSSTGSAIHSRLALRARDLKV